MKQLVVNADDLGICDAANRAVEHAFREGVLTSASLLANGLAFDHAVTQVVHRNSSLGVGLHLSLTSGSSISPPRRVSLLVDHRGRFRHGFLSLWRLTRMKAPEALDQIEREVEAQLERLEAAGLRVDHVDSHRHVHMIPAVFNIVARLARKHGCPAIRVSDEPFRPFSPGPMGRTWRSTLRNTPKKLVLSTFARSNRRQIAGLNAADRVHGILGSGRMDRAALRAAVCRLHQGVTELLVHPAVGNGDIAPGLSRGDEFFWRSRNRQAELRALIDPTLKRLIADRGIRLIAFSEIGSGRRETGVASQG